MRLSVSFMSTSNYLSVSFAKFCAGSTPKIASKTYNKEFHFTFPSINQGNKHFLLFVIAKESFTPDIQQAENPD